MTFIKSFVKELRVTGNEAILTYTMPILPEKITVEKERFLPTVQYGGRYCTKGRTFKLVFGLVKYYIILTFGCFDSNDVQLSIHLDHELPRYNYNTCQWAPLPLICSTLIVPLLLYVFTLFVDS